MNFKIIKQLYKKEILDVLRDKKTVIMMLVVPLLVYPLMFVASMFMMTKVTTELDTQTYTIGINFADSDKTLAAMFEDAENDKWNFEIVDSNTLSVDFQMSLRGERIDAFVTKTKKDGKVVFYISYLSSVTNSGYAVDKVEEVLNAYADMLTRQTLSNAGFNAEEVLNPIKIEYNDYASTEEATGSLLGMIVPFMLVVSLLMGTMYPAIDTTAGERERGTLETILTFPVSNQELIFSKFLTVATIGVASAVLNLFSMGAIGVYVYKLAAQTAQFGERINAAKFVPALLVCCLCILAFAILISALSMCVCVFAKSYKEANNYITPLMLVVMFASFMAFMPNVELTRNMALVPVVNICLLIRDLLAFKFSFSAITIVLFSNVAYGVLAVLLLGKLYNSESILFGDGSAGMQIFERRRNMTKGGVATLGDAWLALPITLVLMIYIGGMVSAKSVTAGILATQLIVAGVPLLIVLYTKKSVRETFRFRGCRPGYFAGAVLLIFGTIILGIILSAITSSFFPNSAKAMSSSMNIIYQLGFGRTMLLVAVLPAVCEELMFRGFLLSAMEKHMKPQTVLLVAAALFGAYHMNMVQSLTTALLGYVIAYVSYHSRSIFPGMLMHFINNALSCIVSFYPLQMMRIFPILAKRALTVSDLMLMIAVGILLVFVGTKIVQKTSKNTQYKVESQP